MRWRLILLTTVFAGACGSSSLQVDLAASGTSVAQTASATASANGTEITIQLTGGSNSGTYKATSIESTCSQGLTGEKSFGNQYSQTGKGDKEVSSLQIMVDDFDEAKKGTSNFTVQFGFGSLINGTSYSLDPRKNIGTGKLTITESGGAKVATIEGRTKEGVGIKAEITCKRVQKMINGELKEQ